MKIIEAHLGYYREHEMPRELWKAISSLMRNGRHVRTVREVLSMLPSSMKKLVKSGRKMKHIPTGSSYEVAYIDETIPASEVKEKVKMNELMPNVFPDK